MPTGEPKPNRGRNQKGNRTPVIVKFEAFRIPRTGDEREKVGRVVDR